MTERGGRSESPNILVVGLLGATLAVAGTAALSSLAVLVGGKLGLSNPTTYTVTLKTDKNGNCTQHATWRDSWGIPRSTDAPWIPISNSNSDTISWTSSSTEPIVTFPSGSRDFPSTPFWDNANTDWKRSFKSGEVSSPATLTPAESAANWSRFAFQSVNSGSNCPMPGGGMGIVVTK